MRNIERLTLDKKDNLLLEFIAKRGAIALCENATFNRGDFFEMAITKEPVKRNGLHEMSKGDYVYNNLVVEIKYLTTKTGASKDLRGTLASHYLIGFNNGQRLEIRLIAKNELITRPDGKREKIAYQDNINKGIRVNL